MPKISDADRKRLLRVLRQEYLAPSAMRNLERRKLVRRMPIAPRERRVWNRVVALLYLYEIVDPDLARSLEAK